MYQRRSEQTKGQAARSGVECMIVTHLQFEKHARALELRTPYDARAGYSQTSDLRCRHVNFLPSEYNLILV